jgi:hypothetical protein
LLAADASLCAIIIDVRASSCSGGLHLRMQLALDLVLRLLDDLPILPSLPRPGGCPGDHCRTVRSVKPATSGSSAVATFSAKAIALKWLKECVRIPKFSAAPRAAFRLTASSLLGLLLSRFAHTNALLGEKSGPVRMLETFELVRFCLACSYLKR